MPVLLGLDAGTSAVKALLVYPDGQQAAFVSVNLTIHRPAPDRSEQTAEDIWAACVQAVRQARSLCDEPVAAIGLSSQRAGVLLLDRHQRPLGELITWQDRRHAAQARKLAASGYGFHPLPGMPTGTLARLLWLRENAPAALDSAAHVLCTVKDWLIFKLTRILCTDRSSVSISGLYDLTTGTWSGHALMLCGLRLEQMSPVLDADQVAGRLTTAAAQELGLAPGIPVAVGCGDGEASNLGLGAVGPGVYGGSIGTVSAVRAISRTLPEERATWPGLYATHLSPLGWVVTGTLATGGAALAWLKEITGVAHFEALERAAGTLHDGPTDLLFIPHMAGMTTPVHQPTARGVFFGLGLHHTVASLARAVMEGVVYGMTAVIEELAKVVPPPLELRIGGGGGRSDLWLSVLASVTAVPVVRTAQPEASALGAAMCAAVPAGFSSSLGAATTLARPAVTFVPSAERIAAYRRAYEVYSELLRGLSPFFASMTKL